MKLFHKIFLCFVVIFSITFQIAGFFLVNFAYKNAIEQEKKYAVQEYQYNKYILQSLMLSEQGIFNEDGALLANRTKSFTTAFAIYDDMSNCLFSNLAAEPELKISNSQENMTNFQLQQDGKGNYVYVYGSVSQNENRVIFVTETNISQTVSIQQEMASFFQKVFLIILGIVFPVIIFLSGFLTRNINLNSASSL